MAKKLIRFALIFIFVLPVLFFLNTGFSSVSKTATFQTLGFATVFCFSLSFPRFKKYIFYPALILITGMAISFGLNLLEWSYNLGSTGFGFVLILILSYLPDFVKKGYIEKL